MRIGLTGGIATGKSTVSRILLKKGYPVIDNDQLSREVIAYPKVIDELVKAFGEQILEEKEKKIARSKLRALVFQSKEKVTLLNAIMHPIIIQKMKDEMEQLSQVHPIIFADVPLLFEAKLDYLFDKILLVYATKEKQIQRIIQRDGTNEEDAKNIIYAQMDIEEKKKKSDYIIDNNGTKEMLEKNVAIFLKKIISKRND